MTNPLPLSVSYDSAAPWPGGRPLVEPLLSVCRLQTRSEGAYVYRLDAGDCKLRLVAWNGLSPSAIERFEVELDAEAAAWWRRSKEPAIVSTAAWQHGRYRKFPEFVHHRFQSAMTVPLKTRAGVVGALTFCRSEPVPYTEAEAALAAGVGRLLGDLASPATEFDRIYRTPADRKLIDRAKGILQADFGLSEEEAYFRLRLTSRRRREPMASVARFLIENHALPGSEAVHAS